MPNYFSLVRTPLTAQSLNAEATRRRIAAKKADNHRKFAAIIWHINRKDLNLLHENSPKK